MAFSMRLSPYLVLVLVGIVPILLLVAAAYVLSSSTLVKQINQANSASATLAGALVAREFSHWEQAIQAHADFPTFAGGVAAGEVDIVRDRLKIIVESYDTIDRAFVADVSGILWADFPMAPESLNQDFSHRDWFAGVTRDFAPYVSEVYQRHAAPILSLVAVAVPVSDPATGEVAGLLVVQLRLDFLSRLVEQLQISTDGYVLLLDHNGIAVAHPRLVLPEGIFPDYTSVIEQLQVQRGLGSVEYVDPVSGERMLASAEAVQVGGNPWLVIAQQPAASAYAVRNSLARNLFIAGGLMLLVVSGLVFGLARAVAGVRDLNRDLEYENQRRKRVEELLREANAELEQRVEERTAELRITQEQLLHSQKLDAIGQLAGGIAHDFNNMLSVIIGYSETALEQLPEDDIARNHLKPIHEAGTRAAALTRQLLAFSRKQVMQPEILNLNDIIGDMESMLQRLIGEHIDLVCKFDPNLDPVCFDQSQIEQVVMNLAVNARDAMPKGGALTIETANIYLDEDYVSRHVESQVGPHVVVSISDNGKGMDAETLDRIFDPFFTTKELGRGTGLGLSTVYGIVKQGGGSIWVYSEPGSGATFKIYLPCAELARTRGEVAKSDAVPETEQGGTILVVEDDQMVLSVVCHMLQGAGYTLLEAAGCDEAVEILKAHARPIDLLLTDVVLPEKRGPEVARAVQEVQPDIPVLYMSGYTDNAIVHHGVLDKGVAFLEKPIRRKRLLEKVRKTMR
jgi:signal transduction histidine kinase/CheY-like chemotaxis protein